MSASTTTLTVTLPGQTGGLFHLLQQAYVSVKTRVQHARTTEHLAGLDDRLLADMGIARRDLAKLYR